MSFPDHFHSLTTYSNILWKRGIRFSNSVPICILSLFFCTWAAGPSSVGWGLDFISMNERLSCLTVAQLHLLHLSTSHFPSLFWPPTDKGVETRGELHSDGECQFGAAWLQSIPPETGAPHPSLLNISLLQLTPSEQGEMQPRMRVLPWERGRGCLAGFSLKTGKLFFSFFRRRLARRSPLPLNDDENTWRERSIASSCCHLWISLKETNHHWFDRRGVLIIHQRLATAWTFIYEMSCDYSANRPGVRWIAVRGKPRISRFTETYFYYLKPKINVLISRALMNSNPIFVIAVFNCLIWK